MNQEGQTAHGIHYRVMAPRKKLNARTIVLVMGYSGNIESWSASFLSELAETHRVVAIDNRGTGKSFRPSTVDEYGMSLFAHDLKVVLAELAIDEFYLLGYSLGGCISLEFVEKYRDQFSILGLILMSTTAGGPLYVAPEASLLKNLAAPQGATILEKSFSLWHQCLSDEAVDRLRGELVAIYEAGLANLTPKITFAGQMAAFRGFDGSTYLANIDVPTLVITGKDDRLMPAGNSVNLASGIKKAALQVIENVEHMPYLEARKVTLDCLTSFAV